MSRQVLTLPDVPPTLLTQSAADLKYLPLAGGTITGTVGHGVTPKATWGAARAGAIQVGIGGSIYGHNTAPQLVLAGNNYEDAVGPKAITAGLSARLTLGQDGNFYFDNAPNAAADGVQTFAQRMRLDANGNLGFGATSTSTLLPADIHPQRPTFRIAEAGVLMGGPGYNALEIRANSYQNISNVPIALAANAASAIALVNNQVTVSTAPSVAAGAQQTFSTRFAVNSSEVLVYSATANSNLYLHNGNSTNMRLATGAGNLELSGASGVIHPSYDNSMALGATNVRWTQVCAVAGAINTSSRDMKEIIGTVNDTVALEQLLSLPAIYRFYYKHRRSPEEGGEENDELVADTTQEFIGPVAEEMPMDMKVGETDVSNVNTEGHLMASLRGAVLEYRTRLTHLEQRIAAVEGRLPA